MRLLFIFLLPFIFVACSGSSTETYTAMDGSGKKIVYNKETKEVYELNKVHEAKK